MYLLNITLTLVNKHQLRGYIGYPGSDCLRLCTSCDRPTIKLSEAPTIATVSHTCRGRSKHRALVSTQQDIVLPHPPHLARLTCPIL